MASANITHPNTDKPRTMSTTTAAPRKAYSAPMKHTVFSPARPRGPPHRSSTRIMPSTRSPDELVVEPEVPEGTQARVALHHEPHVQPPRHAQSRHRRQCQHSRKNLALNLGGAVHGAHHAGRERRPTPEELQSLHRRSDSGAHPIGDHPVDDGPSRRPDPEHRPHSSECQGDRSESSRQESLVRPAQAQRGEASSQEDSPAALHVPHAGSGRAPQNGERPEAGRHQRKEATAW